MTISKKIQYIIDVTILISNNNNNNSLCRAFREFFCFFGAKFKFDFESHNYNYNNQQSFQGIKTQCLKYQSK